mgnify:FL=1|jgi:nucleoside-diphosphate-sugar epimerase
MKFTLIGGAGFIGSQLMTYLPQFGHEVKVIDNLTYGQNFGYPDEVKLINDDVKNIGRYETELNEADYVFYMASPRLNEINDLEEPLPHLAGLKTTLDICQNNNTQVIFFSSCSVYGYRKNMVNELSTTKVTSLYSKLKIDSENLLKKYDEDRFKIVRLSTLFGTSGVGRNDLLVNNFVKDVLFSQYLEVYDPEAWRPNINIHTLCGVLKELAEKNAFQSILNIGYNILNTTKQELILKMVTRNKLDFTVKYYSPDDSRSYKVDFSKMEELIDLEPIQYVDGIDQLVSTFREVIIEQNQDNE